MITNHTQLLNYLIEKYNLKSYCEIGVQNPANNYHRIKLPIACKVGVDPCFTVIKDNLLPITSDVFFKSQTDTFDLFFIDGLHTEEQVEKDFNNAVKCLNNGGFIVCHDTLPDEEIETCIPRGEQKKWMGSVYKWAMKLNSYEGIDFVTVNTDCGCTIVWKCVWKDIPGPLFPYKTWNDYLEYRNMNMNIISPVDIEIALPPAYEPTF